MCVCPLFPSLLFITMFFFFPATHTGPRLSNERRSAETRAEIILCYVWFIKYAYLTNSSIRNDELLINAGTDSKAQSKWHIPHSLAAGPQLQSEQHAGKRVKNRNVSDLEPDNRARGDENNEIALLVSLKLRLKGDRNDTTGRKSFLCSAASASTTQVQLLLGV